MIKVILDLISANGPEHDTRLGEILISNTDTGTEDCGNYNVLLKKSPRFTTKSGIWRTGHVEGFARLTKGPYDLLFLALEAALGPKRIAELHGQAPPANYNTAAEPVYPAPSNDDIPF